MDGTGSTAPPEAWRSDLIEDPTARYTLIAFSILAILLSAAGNGYLLILIYRKRKSIKRSSAAIMIFHLAFCDFVNATFHQPIKLIDILLYGQETRAGSLIFCKITGYLSSLFDGLGFLSIVSISFERLILICFPLHAKRLLTRRNIFILLVCIWIFVSLTCLPVPILFSYYITVPLEKGSTAFCIIDSISSPRKGMAYVWFAFLVYFLFPVIAITVCYALIFRTMHTGKLIAGVHTRSAMRMLEKRKSMAKVMISIAAIFVASHGPRSIAVLVTTMGHIIPDNAIFTMLVLDLLTLISPILNPVVYSVKNKSVRKDVFGTDTKTQSVESERTSLMSLLRGKRRTSSSPRSETQRLRESLAHLPAPNTLPIGSTSGLTSGPTNNTADIIAGMHAGRDSRLHDSEMAHTSTVYLSHEDALRRGPESSGTCRNSHHLEQDMLNLSDTSTGTAGSLVDQEEVRQTPNQEGRNCHKTNTSKRKSFTKETRL